MSPFQHIWQAQGHKFEMVLNAFGFYFDLLAVGFDPGYSYTQVIFPPLNDIWTTEVESMQSYSYMLPNPHSVDTELMNNLAAGTEIENKNLFRPPLTFAFPQTDLRFTRFNFLPLMKWQKNGLKEMQ